MNGQWRPGDVAMVTVDGEEHVAVRASDGKSWVMEPAPVQRRTTAARRLVVIDPEDREQVQRIVALLHDGSAWWQKGVNQPTHTSLLQKALREFANPTPPKPEEPTGLGAVVRDVNGDDWVRCSAKNFRKCSGERLGAFLPYWGIEAVEVLSEGVTP